MSVVARQPRVAAVESLDHAGRGVARVDGKATFIAGALPGEQVRFRYVRRHRGYDEAETVEVIEPAAARVTPRCAHFGACGGCALQHLTPTAQRATKQAQLLDALRRIGKVEPARLLEPLVGPVWGYRRRARLGVHWQRDARRAVIGFRGRESHALAPLARCEVLDARVGALIAPLAELVGALSRPDRVPQIEVAAGETGTVLVLRTLAPLGPDDAAKLRAFGAAHHLGFWLQPGGPDTAAPLDPGTAPTPAYWLDHGATRIEFRPQDFVQVNGALNAVLVERVLELLELDPGQRVLDLFAGLGNFTLPIARRVAHAVGVEGEAGLVARARQNAARNGMANADFHLADLFVPSPDAPWAAGRYDRVLLDPPRSGAREILPNLRGWKPARVVYVSCHPASLARDAGILAGELGYRLEAVGVVDMFPHTAHVESLAVFAR